MRNTAPLHADTDLSEISLVSQYHGFGYWLKRHVRTIFGLSMIALSGVIALSLATWSVNDPSLSHATSAPVQNLLGRNGAIIADLLMQFFGLGSTILLVVIALWGWRLLRGRALTGLKRRIIITLLALICTSSAFSALPVTQNWPMPLGMGGVMGDLIIWLPARIFGNLFPGMVATITTFCFGSLSVFLFILSTGRYTTEQTEPDYDRIVFASEEIADERDEKESHFFSWFSLGALVHVMLYSKAIVTRLWRKLAKRWYKAPPDAPRIVMPPIYHLDNEEDIYQDEALYHESFQPQVTPSSDALQYAEPVVNANRVSMPKAKLTPSKRVKIEAQADLLQGDEYSLPPIHLLSLPSAKNKDYQINSDALEQNARLLEGVLEDFGVRGEIIQVRPGPVVTLYELEPAPGIKSARIIGLADDIARSMSAISARVAVIPGRNAIGIELPNARRETVYFRELISAKDFENTKAKLALCLGKTIGGEAVIADLTKMPHLLVAGTTGSGKSVSINTMILSLLYRMTPEQCRLIMIDPKMLELSVYDGIPHLLSPVVTDPKKAVVALKWTVREMEERYKKMSKLGVRNIDGFNARIAKAAKKGEVITRTVQTGFDHDTGEAIYEQEALHFEPMPYIVVIIDEMADLMMVAGKEIEGAVQRLAQMARAAGIHVIMATQRPSVDVITGTIKANFPTRISFQVTSKIDSRTILGEQGAEQLLGMGDMLYMAGGGRIQRVHGPFVSDNEVEDVVAHLKAQGIPEYLEDVTDESDMDVSSLFDTAAGASQDGENDLYAQAVTIVLRDQKASTSYVQRRLSIGYNRAASIIERMEEEGIISSANHAGKREILQRQEEEMI